MLGLPRFSGQSEKKILIVSAVSLNEAVHPVYFRISDLSGFSSGTIAGWSNHYLALGSLVLTDGLACFRAMSTACSHHKAFVTG